MKTTPFELVFGQPSRSIIAPDATTGGIVDEGSDDDQGRFHDIEHESNTARVDQKDVDSSIHEVSDEDVRVVLWQQLHNIIVCVLLVPRLIDIATNALLNIYMPNMTRRMKSRATKMYVGSL